MVKKKKIIVFIFSFLIIVYTFYKVNLGVDLGDQTYCLGNYKWMRNLESMWLSGTILSNFIGYIMTLLPGGNYMLGMNIYTSFIKLALALISYFFCVKELEMPVVPTFLCEIAALGLCWNPCTVLYNYLTFLFFLIACISLYYGILKEKGYMCFVIVGVALALNVFVRFSNLPEIILLLTIFICGEFVVKIKRKEYIKEFLICILSYVGTLICGGVIISFTTGLAKYIDGIMQLFNIDPGDGQYTAVGMIINILKYYWHSRENFLIILGVCLVILLLEFVFKRVNLPIVIPRVLGIVFSIVILGIFFKRHLYSFDWKSYSSVMDYGFHFFIIIMFSFLWTAIRKSESKIRVICVILLISMFIIPLGSNNLLYILINNLFLILPVLAYIFFVNIEKRKYQVISFFVCGLMTFFIFQSILFGHFFVYGDSNAREGGYIKNSKVLTGMKTGYYKELDAYMDFIDKYSLYDKKIIVYQAEYGVPYIFNTPFDIKSSGYFLLSYKGIKVNEEINELNLRLGKGEQEYPYIVIESYLRGLINDYYFANGIQSIPENYMNAGYNDFDQKMLSIIDFMIENNYYLAETSDLGDLYLAE